MIALNIVRKGEFKNGLVTLPLAFINGRLYTVEAVKLTSIVGIETLSIDEFRPFIGSTYILSSSRGSSFLYLTDYVYSEFSSLMDFYEPGSIWHVLKEYQF